MRSRPARLILGAGALVALGAAAFFVNRSEHHITAMRVAERAFDVLAREAADGLADLRASQAAYVAAGQGVAFWMPKVAATAAGVTQKLAELRATASDDATRAALDAASATIVEFGNVDRRAREYLTSGQQLMAGDIIFTEGGQSASVAAQEVNAARAAEHQAVEAAEYSYRRQQAAAVGGAAAITVLVLIVLVPGGSPAAARTEIEPASVNTSSVDAAGLALRDAPTRPSTSGAARSAGPVLRAASQLCTNFGRVSDVEELKTLVGQAADLMDASGLVVWVASANGAELSPALSHGYTPQVLARMGAIPRSADNAAAAAVRTRQLQIVLARPGSSSGAVVAPLLSPEGCVGALSAEIRSGGETSESVQALAAIFAAQLSGVLHTPPASHEQRATGTGTV